MASNQTYGVTTAEVQAYLPQVTLGGANDPITSARFTILLQHSASRLNGIFLGVVLDPDSIVTTSTSIEYQNAQQIVIGLMLRHIMAGLTIGAGVPEAVELADWAEGMLVALTTRPELLGATDSTIAPMVSTTVGMLNLDMTQNEVNKRRPWMTHDSPNGKQDLSW